MITVKNFQIVLIFMFTVWILLVGCISKKIAQNYYEKHPSEYMCPLSVKEILIHGDTIQTHDTEYVHHYDKIPCPDNVDSIQCPDNVLIHDLQYVHDTLLVENINKLKYQEYVIDSLKKEYNKLSLIKQQGDNKNSKMNWIAIILAGIGASLTLFIKQKLKHK